MENALKGLMMAAGITITCMVIGLGFLVAREAKQTAAETSGQMAEFRNRLYESSYTAYDGAVVSGAELANFLRFQLNQRELGHKVPEYFDIIDGGTIRLTKADDCDAVSLSPYSTYTGAVIRGHGGGIVGLTFTKN